MKNNAMYFLNVYVIACVCISTTFSNLSTEVNNPQRVNSNATVLESSVISDRYPVNISRSDFLNVNITSESSVFNDSIRENEFIESSESFENETYVRNVTDSFQSLQESNISFTDNLLFTNFTELTDTSIGLYNSSEINHFTDSFELLNLTESLTNFTESLINFTESQDVARSFPSEDLKTDDLLNSSDKHIVKKQPESDVSFQKEKDKFNEESAATESTMKFKEYEENLRISTEFVENPATLSGIGITTVERAIEDPTVYLYRNESSQVTENLELTNFTELTDVILESYNTGEFNDTTQSIELKKFTEPITNFTESQVLERSLQFENETEVREDYLNSTDKGHVVVKRDESDASFQRELEEFDEEAVANETLNRIKEFEANQSITPEMNEQKDITTTLEPDVTTEEPTTTEGPTIYPYTSPDGLIDVVADNGIKYISSESDNFPRSGEEEGNLAGITDDSEPMHYVISGESNLSEDSQKEVGIEDLLPDYVKPTVSGESADNDIGVIETATSSEQIVLSESVEEPTTTTTTEPVTWAVNSWEFKGDKYEGADETQAENITTLINQTKLEDEDTSLNMEYRDEEDDEIKKVINNTNNIISYNIPTQPTKIEPSTQYDTESTTSQFDKVNVQSNERENSTSEEKTTSEEETEYDPWKDQEPTSDDDKSVIGNSIDLDELKKKGEQAELIEMSFDSSSNNSTDFSLESEHIANTNFSIKNIELSNSESEDETEEESKESGEDYDIDKEAPILNMNNEVQLNNKNITKNENTGLNKTEKLEENVIYNSNTSAQLNDILLSTEISNMNLTDGNEEKKSNITKIPTTHIKHKGHSSKKRKIKHSNNNVNKKNEIKSNVSKDEEPTNVTMSPSKSEIGKAENEQNIVTNNANTRRKRGIFKSMLGVDGVEHTTPYHWPQNSRENHGELFESNENNTKSEDFSYFRASGHYSDYDDYSGNDVSVHVMEKNTSEGVKIFVTKKNGTNDLQKDYEDFKEQFQESPVESSNKRHRRDVEEKLLRKYQRFSKQQNQYEPNLDEKPTPVSKMELENMLSKIFLSKLMKLSPRITFTSQNIDKFIFKAKDCMEEGIKSNQLEFLKAHRDLKKETNENQKPSTKIKTKIQNGNYRWNKELNCLEKISDLK